MAQRTPKPGEQLLALMEKHTPVVRKANLARELGKTTTSVGRYFKQLDDGTIDDRVWAQMAEILVTKYNIAAGDVRPVNAAPVGTIDTSLMPYLDLFESAEQLGALVKILEGSNKQQARDVLLVLARDRLARL